MEFLYEELEEKTYKEFIETLKIKIILKSPLLNKAIPFLADGFAEINLRVNEVLMNARTYAHYRKLGRDILDIETNAEKLKQGIMGYIWGATIIIREKIPENIILILSEPEKHEVVILQFEDTYNRTSDLIHEISELKILSHKTQNILQDIDTILYDLLLKKENK